MKGPLELDVRVNDRLKPICVASLEQKKKPPDPETGARVEECRIQGEKELIPNLSGISHVVTIESEHASLASK